ncbi:TetR/AcrR family transcriptional regulator [Chitiniphilus purpureus]|uniref:TetR/AcrR family transcriptional regulator n=1 Tax=Chitiniphilus purpureus TaxID=2981137 RepID=A0ABY6DR83_9NEIS|nr:TetR/AcrR family transcriptional regulator [Chitiniphilus sp. CD1]UXY16223.1 TetR/AcrR family transcriptional regulator [Chitiniphilus sp. CD1]
MHDCPFAKRWSRRKAARPQEILEAALDLFAEKGYAATKMGDIAKRAGVTCGTPYRYFKSKEEIFASLIRELVLPKLALGESLLAEPDVGAAARLRTFLFTWWTQIGESRLSALPKLMVAEAKNFPEVAELYQKEFIQPGQALLKRVVEDGIARGEFRAVPVEHAVQTLMSPVVMLMIWQHSLVPCFDPDADPRSYLEAMLDLVLHGLMPRSAIA